MTKGEYPENLKDPDSEAFRLNPLDAKHNHGEFSGNLILNKDSDNLYLVSGEQTNNTGRLSEINGVHNIVLATETRNNNQFNAVDYVQNLRNNTVKQTITRILSKDDVEESEIDINDIEHYLLVAAHLNSQNTLRCCENKLIPALTRENCVEFYQLAEQYNLKQLQEAAFVIIQNKCVNQIRDSANQNDTSSQNQALPANKLEIPTGCKSNNRYQSYHAMFTCGIVGSKRTVATVVFDSNMERKCYKDLKQGNKITKQFPCCCVQSDKDVDPLVFFSFGSSVYRYDPILNKCKKRKSLTRKRSKFCMVAHDNHCYVIGGVYKGRKVLQIEELSCAKKNGSWKKVAMLPRECLPIDSSCVVFNDSIYIFCAIVTEDNKIKRATGVYIFNPSTKTVKPFVEIPYSFKQIKTCVLNSYIYIASDQGEFIRFCPRGGSFTSCPHQIIRCKHFGIFTRENSIFLAGGECGGNRTDVIRKYCVISERWEKLSAKLPDCMTICDSLEVKIPNKWGAVVPFYETNFFGKR